MNKRISRISTETVDSILRSLGTGTKKAKLVEVPYLSQSHVSTHLSLLLNRGFIEHERESRLYKITPSGAEFLDSMDELREMVGEPRKQFYQ
jgi:predicted transcriptional regulator